VRVLALDELHDQRAPGARIFNAVDLRDVRMVEGGECLRFAFETHQTIRIARERLRQNLERDIAIELRVARAIDLAHATRAEQL
jgi:hypothetical protein